MIATELRIGNYIKGGNIYQGRELTVSSVGLDIIFFFNGFAGEYIKDCEPIPITPEWLEKFGFKRFESKEDEVSDKVIYYSLGKLTICDWGSGLVLSNSFSFDLRVNLSHVHQLQNLYFALTNEELKIKKETAV